MDLSRIVPLFVVIVFTRLVASPGADGSEALDLPPAPLHYVIAGQTTVVWQYHPAFRSPYEGPRSLDHRPEDAVSHSYTLYTGVRLLPWLDLYLSPEMIRGGGIGSGIGLAGYTNGEGWESPSRRTG